MSTPSIPSTEVPPVPAPPVALTGSTLNLWGALLALLLAIAGVSYAWKGSVPIRVPVAATGATGAQQMNTLVERLALKLQDRPQDAEGWAMLARSYAVLGRHAQALPAFERAMALRPEDGALRAAYASSMALSKPLPGTAPDQPEAGAALAAPSAAVSKGTLSGRVTLSSAVAKLVSPDDTVFIFARAAQGDRTPLAVLRKQVKDLPLRFTLDDSMGMSPQNRLSAAGQVVVSARISKSGQPMPQAGDIAGQAAPVSVGTSDLAIELRELVK